MSEQSSLSYQAVLKVVSVLRDAGYQALLAGGCVRDKLLGVIPKDYDVATNAVPNEVVRLFHRTLTVGAQFGVVIVMIGSEQIEVATFRSDANYSDGRRPEKVVFTDAEHDAQRRDFTINGMFYDPIADEVIDYVGGREDLDKQVIRAIGNPHERFAEDHLRMLRAVRFASRLGFSIDQATVDAVKQLAGKITQISAERIAMETELILVDKNRHRGMAMAASMNLLEQIFPDLSDDQVTSGLAVLCALEDGVSFPLALAAFLVECDQETVQTVTGKLKLSNEVRRDTAWLVQHRTELVESIPFTKGPLKLYMANPLFNSLAQLIYACQLTSLVSGDRVQWLGEQIKAVAGEEIEPARLLDGHELKELGVPAGPMIGEVDRMLYLAQLEGEVTSVDQARQWVKDYLSKQ